MIRFPFQFFVIAAFLTMTQSVFAAKVCLQDNYGAVYELKGGRPDKKTYTVKTISIGLYIAGGYADVTTNSLGEYRIAIYTAHDLNGVWIPVLYSATGDENFNSVGTYDTLADGSIEGDVIFTNIPCSSLPPTKPALKEQPKYSESLDSSIEEYCFSDNFGNLYSFIGGKLGKKAFATEVSHPSCGVLSGITTFAKRDDGTFTATTIIGQDSAGGCVAFEITASFPSSMLSGSGNYDNFPRNFDSPGTISFTAFSCANFESGVVKKPVAPVSGPGSPTVEEQR